MLVIKISNENNRAIIIIMIDNKNDNVPCDRLEHQQAI